MRRVIILGLSALNILHLNAIVERGVNWRQRQRAKTLILPDQGLDAKEVAQLMDLNVSTVRSTRKEWFISGFESLHDLPRSGAPRKISPEELGSLVASASEQPLTAPQLLALHVSAGGAKVHLNTLITRLRRSGRPGKRSTHCG